MMKKLNSILLCMIATMALLVTACSKDQGNTATNKEETEVLRVNVAAIQKLGKSSKMSSADRGTSNQTQAKTEETQHDGFTIAVTSAESDLRNFGDYPILKRDSTGKRRDNESSPMSAGMSYRILLYYKSNGKFAKSAFAKAGQALEIPVVKKEEYDWYAYSYNTSENIPEPTNTSNPIIETPKDKDLLYASGTIRTEEGENKLQITFSHKLAQVYIEVAVEDMYAIFTDLKTSLPSNEGFNQGDFNIRTGNTSNIRPYSTDNIELTTVKATKDDVRAVTLYSADPEKLKNFDFQIQSLSVKLSDSSFETLINVTQPSDIAFSFTSPEVGKRLYGKVNISREGIILDGLEWSQGNLYYEDGVHKFRENQVDLHTESCNDYWRWNAKLPNDAPGTGDPCAEVFPNGTWRLPTFAEIEALTFRKEAGNEDGGGYGNYVEYRPNNGKRPYLRFNEGGEMSSSCSLSNKTNGYYWSSDEKSKTQGYALRVDGSILGGDGRAKIIDKSKTHNRYNVRCVKTASN